MNPRWTAWFRELASGHGGLLQERAIWKTVSKLGGRREEIQARTTF